MDRLWLAAPAAAVQITDGPGGRTLRPNDAASRWAARAGLAPAVWQDLAAAALADLAIDHGSIMLGAQEGPTGWRRIDLPDGNHVCWIEPAVEAQQAQAVRRATEFLDRALDLAGISVWRVDLVKRRVHFNTVGFHAGALQQDPNDITLKAMRDSMHPDDRARVVAAADEAIRTGQAVDVVARYRDPDGGWRRLLTRRIADHGADGTAIGLTGVSLDITSQLVERERADALAERSRLVAETMGVGFWSREMDGGTAHWDDQMYRIHRRDPALGAPALDGWIHLYVHPQDQAWVIDLQQRATRDWEAMVDATFRVIGGDGVERWVQAWTRRLVRDGRRLMFGMHLDVTAREVARALTERERWRTQYALAAADVGVWERASDGHISYWNEGMYRLRGLQPDDTRSLDDLARLTTDPDDYAAVMQMVRSHLAGGSPYRFEMRVRRADGQLRWMATQGRALHDADGRLLGMAGVNFDITERKAADALRLENERVEQISREKSAFLARVSHELRTPMNAVLGFAQLMEGDPVDVASSAQRARLRRIAEAGAQMMALVDDLLDLANVDATAPAPPASVQAATHLLRQTLHTLDGVARLRGVTLRLVPGGADACLSVDRRLAQILVHLAGHAIRQQRRGGWVELGCSLERDTGTAPSVLLTVRDNGPGYSATERATLFEPFVRHGGNERSRDGTGVGLSLAQRLCHAVGGRLDVHSRPGEGCEFRLHLPAATPQGTVASTPPSVAGVLATSPPLDVLCIEDNPVNLMLVGELLSRRPGVVLRTAADGATGIALALAARPDLVLLDLQLPDINGLDVLARLRAERTMDGCIYVALSANAMPDHIAAARRAGFDEYWTKPIDFEHFLAGIDRLSYGASRSRTQLPASSL